MSTFCGGFIRRNKIATRHLWDRFTSDPKCQYCGRYRRDLRREERKEDKAKDQAQWLAQFFPEPKP